MEYYLLGVIISFLFSLVILAVDLQDFKHLQNVQYITSALIEYFIFSLCFSYLGFILILFNKFRG